ncbi:enoyl-CoA delta isomerase 1, peroxisomal-like [Chenopodium quinoa]|uniref:Delta(3)-Delta(2)-enoyl-CoA isomerase n=1 Tax=Chenopodium quinoa TaxID=63459 RepID=A0A803N086_CHEQI|nr:enoyl-CoA delta isomerase 1, peroxisomal-like [Chenopodium quinoa]
MCTVEKRGNLYILTLTGNNEHRLNPTLISSIRSCLSQIKSQSLKSKTPSALITTAHGKFFSNGYDVAWVNSSSNPKLSEKIMDSQLQALIAELISFPMPTIAAINGHASAAGFILAMAHDFVLMRRERGYLYMSEVDIGLVIPPWFMAVMKCKIGGGWEGMRKVGLMAEKVTAEKGKREIGIVHEVFEGAAATVEGAVELGEELVKRSWDGVVYGENRKVLLKEVLDLIGNNEGLDFDFDDHVIKFKPRL